MFPCYASRGSFIGMDDLTEPNFLRHPPGLTLGEIAALTGAELQDVTSYSQRMTNVAPIDLAEAGDLTFVDNLKFAKALKSTRAGAVLISKHLALPRPKRPRRIAYAGALQVLRVGGARTLSGHIAPLVAFRNRRYRAGCIRPSLRPTRERRDG